MGQIDKDKLARLAHALDDRSDNKVLKESERAIQAETELQNNIDNAKEMIGGKTFVYLTQAEYDLLSEEEKNNTEVLYYITDFEDRIHDHYNKDLLDMIDDEFMNNLGRGQMIEATISAEGGWYRVAESTSGTGIGAQLGLFNIHEYGTEFHSNTYLFAGVNNDVEPILQQMVMQAFTKHRVANFRVVYQSTGDDINGYLEVYFEPIDNITNTLRVQILGKSEWQLIEPVLTESVDETIYTIKEMEPVPGKIVGDFEGVIESANRLNNPRNITIGQCSREFDGSTDISYTLNEIGAAPKTDARLTTENKELVGAINELDAEMNNIDAVSVDGYSIWVGTTEELNAISKRDENTIYFEIDNEKDNDGVREVPVENNMVLLYEDKRQKVTNMTDVTRIILPNVDRFVEIHLYFNAATALNIGLPEGKWRNKPAIEAGKSYELIAVYNSMEWLLDMKVYC